MYRGSFFCILFTPNSQIHIDVFIACGVLFNATKRKYFATQFVSIIVVFSIRFVLSFLCCCFWLCCQFIKSNDWNVDENLLAFILSLCRICINWKKIHSVFAVCHTPVVTLSVSKLFITIRTSLFRRLNKLIAYFAYRHCLGAQTLALARSPCPLLCAVSPLPLFQWMYVLLSLILANEIQRMVNIIHTRSQQLSSLLVVCTFCIFLSFLRVYELCTHPNVQFGDTFTTLCCF